MRSKAGSSALRQETAALREKPAELSEDELSFVPGGTSGPELRVPGPALVPARGRDVAPPSSQAGFGVTLTSSALEMSNEDITKEFEDRIKTERGFEANSRALTAEDEMPDRLLNEAKLRQR